MKLMSFAMTERQLLDGQKRVTRRLGWRYLNKGDRICAAQKTMGLARGERVKRLAVLEILSVRFEPLCAITPEDVALEGFPGQNPIWFIEMFAQAMRCDVDDDVTRIEFRMIADLSECDHGAAIAIVERMERKR